MTTAQVALGLMALVCAIGAFVLLYRGGDEQRVGVISLLALAILFTALMVWAFFLPNEATVMP